MTFELEDGGYEEVIECWAVSPNAIEVLVRPRKSDENQWVRITAKESIRSGATPRYWAGYEELTILPGAGGDEQRIWVDKTWKYPWQDGDTIQECLQMALQWVTSDQRDT